MELRHLRYFVAVARELHFGRAAEGLAIAQPALSQQIQKLEHEVGARLLRRTNRKVELTEPGRLFFSEAEAILARSDQAIQAARRAERGEIGRLAVGFVSSATYDVLPPVVRGFRRRHAGVALTLLELTTAEQIAALEAGRLDLGFVRTPPDSPRLEQRVLVEEEFLAALPASHRLARSRRLALRDLCDDPFLVFPRTMAMGLYDRIVSACREAGFSPNIVQEATQPPVILGLVAAGLGVALVPECVRRLKWRNVVYRPLHGPRPRTNLTLAWRNPPDSPAVGAFVDEAARVLPRRGARPDTGV